MPEPSAPRNGTGECRPTRLRSPGRPPERRGPCPRWLRLEHRRLPSGHDPRGRRIFVRSIVNASEDSVEETTSNLFPERTEIARPPGSPNEAKWFPLSSRTNRNRAVLVSPNEPKSGYHCSPNEPKSRGRRFPERTEIRHTVPTEDYGNESDASPERTEIDARMVSPNEANRRTNCAMRSPVRLL